MRAVIALLPSLTLVAGLMLGVGAAGGTVPAGSLRFALAAAIIAPVAAAAVLTIAAPGFDVILVASAGMLIAIGTTTVYGLSLSPLADGEFYASIATRHGLFVAAGYVALFAGVLAERSLDHARQYPFTMLLAALVLTVATVLFGVTVNGARLWLELGPVRFQPSEVARFLIAMFVAVFLYERRHLLAAPWRVRAMELPPAPYLVPLAGALVIAVGVLVLQNDLGMAALVVLGAGAVVVSVVRSRATAWSAVLLLGGALLGAYAAVPRVRDRVVGWLDPWRDPAGRGYQFVQADYSLGAGSLAGEGPGLAAGNVPEVHTDLILVAVASQFGLLAGLALLALASVLVARCLLAALRTDDGFRSLVALSLAVLFAIQIVLIAGGSLRVLPLTGLTFPLVSYGGTSMIVTMFAVGIVVGIGVRGRRAPRRTRPAGGDGGWHEVAGNPGRARRTAPATFRPSGRENAVCWAGAGRATT